LLGDRFTRQPEGRVGIAAPDGLDGGGELGRGRALLRQRRGPAERHDLDSVRNARGEETKEKHNGEQPGNHLLQLTR
jgi:hypothetical protein